MARQVLENGVVLPAEYSDDWYNDMTSNLTKLDDVIGSDSEKLSSADVGAAALSNNYNDLDNLPTIPTVNDATLTIQKNGVDVQTFTANASSNVTANITVPTKTSDLTNDSNFVDTSNSAVSSGITSAKVTSYDSHIADTDIHVTTADKNKWNNGVSQAYVFRYSSTALTASSTNSNTLLDNTDNLKVGDKVIDSSGVLFSITAIDTANSTFTVGSALIDLAQDSNVVHTSGDETIAGQKTFRDQTLIYNPDNTANTPNIILKNSRFSRGSTTELDTQYIRFTDKSSKNCGQLSCYGNSAGNTLISLFASNTDSNNQTINSYVTLSKASSGNSSFYPNNDNETNLGTSSKKWSKIYGTEYYYGSNNVEFSTKFVTTDTDQTISRSKTFSSDLSISNTDTTANTPSLRFRNYKVARGSTVEIGGQILAFLDKGGLSLGSIESRVLVDGGTALRLYSFNKDSGNQTISSSIDLRKYSDGSVYLIPDLDNDIWLGNTLKKWKGIFTNQINNLTPSSLGLPSDRNTRVDISSYITNLGNGDNNSYVVPANGYIWLHFTSINSALCYSQTPGGLTNYAQTFVRYSGDGQLYAFFPVKKDDYFIVQIYTSSTAVVQNAYFIPCQGNV